jgi:hypothetical protein
MPQDSSTEKYSYLLIKKRVTKQMKKKAENRNETKM